jgi:ribosomal protein S18 acetylase RimI-like enzyme
MTGTSLRKAELQDVPGIVACIDAAYARYRGEIDALPPVSEGVDQDIAENQVWVVEQDGAVAGVLVLVTCENFIKLANVAVHPNQSGKGLGRRLIDHAVETSQMQEFGEIRLNTHAEMTDNIALYQHLGWHETERSGSTVTMSRKI